MSVNRLNRPSDTSPGQPEVRADDLDRLVAAGGAGASSSSQAMAGLYRRAGRSGGPMVLCSARGCARLRAPSSRSGAWWTASSALAGLTGLPSTLAASSEPSARSVPTAVTRLPTAMSASDAVLSPRIGVGRRRRDVDRGRRAVLALDRDRVGGLAGHLAGDARQARSSTVIAVNVSPSTVPCGVHVGADLHVRLGAGRLPELDRPWSR